MIPLGLACLQAYLKSNDTPVKVFNFRSSSYSLPRAILDPLIQLKPLNFIMNHHDFPILIHLSEFILKGHELKFEENILSELIKDYAMRVHEPVKETIKRYESIIEYLGNILPLIEPYHKIGFSIDYLNIIETILASAYLKQYDNNIKIIWGGPSITQSFEAFKILLSKGLCDGLVIGEGESPILDFARGTNIDQIKGIMSYKNNSKNEFIYKKGPQLDLDLLPTPDYDNIPLDTYFYWASVYRSRGCTNRCKFCAEWFLFGPKFRVRSVENVVDDIDTIIKKHKPKYMIFGESLINDDLAYFEELCDAMIERDFNMKFGTHFRANITSDLAKKAAMAGFNDAWVGVEAATDNELNEMNKGISTNQNIETIKNFTQAGMNVLAMIVVGFSSLEHEERNCEAMIKLIKEFSRQSYVDEHGFFKPLKIQWRPAPAYLVPSSIDYNISRDTQTKSWSPLYNKNDNGLALIEKELKDIPYEFNWKIPAEKVGSFIKRIQDADRQAGFAIGGITEHVIKTLAEMRKQQRQQKK